MKKKIVVEAIALIFVLLWVYAAFSKLADFTTFKGQLAKSPFVTDMVTLVAWGVPLTELVIAALLGFPRTQLVGLYASFFLISLFTGYIYFILNFSYYIPCSCGGIISHMSWKQHFIFNVTFVILSLIAILFAVRKQISHHLTQQPSL